MRIPGLISAAIEVLDDIESRHRPASAALRDWGLNHRFAGSGDRASIGNIVYDVLRRRRSLAWRMGADTSRALALAVVGLDWKTGADELAGLVELDRHGPGPLTEQERQALSGGNPLDAAPEALQADIQDWCRPHIETSLSVDWLTECRALAERPPLDLRVNTLKADRDRVMGQLARLKPQACRLSPVGIRIPPSDGARRHPNIQADDVWQRGRVEVQDEGSQLCALLTGAKPGDQVLDFCAGAGGKALTFAAMMENRGQIYAHDADRNRLAPIYDRLKRAGARNVQVRPPGDDGLGDLQERMDLVFVDAPCSGSGVWRRHPDAKWRLTPEALRTRLEEQETVLDQAAACVRTGGVLAYATCSIFAEENEGQIAAFRERYPAFRLVSLVERVGDLAEDACSLVHCLPDGSIRLTPARSGTDGFYLACLRRD
jgi:16S rRNA (cytosine967-C5)-methyltransferase